MFRERSDPGRKRNGIQGQPLMDNNQGASSSGQLRHAAGGVFCVGFRKNDRKFLATKTADDVIAAKISTEEIGQLAEESVAGIVAVNIVEALEVIEIEEHNGERTALTSGALQLAVKRLLHEAAVEEAGERVANGLVAKCLP